MNLINKDNVLLRVEDTKGFDDDESFAKLLTTFGFSGTVADDSDGSAHAGASTYSTSHLNIATQLSASIQRIADNADVAASELSLAVDREASADHQVDLDLSRSNLESYGAVALMAQMSLPYVPIPAFGVVPDRLPKHHAHFVRSVIFWRNRNGIARMTPRLVHAGEDGTLVFILGSWLVALNWNDEEISIDVGSGGSMWLMLGTPRDVQLQGSLLVLPAYSGAILANELAR